MEIENKIALVTGGTSGIGKEIVKQLLELNTIVIVNYGYNENQMNETKKNLKVMLINCYLLRLIYQMKFK